MVVVVVVVVMVAVEKQQQQQHRGQVATRREPGNLGGTEFSRAKLPAAIGDIHNDSLGPIAQTPYKVGMAWHGVAGTPLPHA
ncbi:hypothetical protein M0804_014182 [Polistes exclamans]|nr:hypothetical protein M0804_014188 [Polistes exclamans]KAI4475633.1 hypothetical protein M0804_014182 [Polistes exclamans]